MSKKQAKTWRAGGCHCRAVRFEVHVPSEIELVDCNCSMCAKTGFLHLIVPKSEFRLLKGKTKLTTYTFNTGVAKHFFCSKCGIKSFYIPRSHPDGYSVNFRCLDDREHFKSVSTVEFNGKEWENNASKLSPLERA